MPTSYAAMPKLGNDAGKKATHTVSAWLIEYDTSQYIALPHKSCQEITEKIEVITFPGIASYGVGLVQWRNAWLPLIDFGSLVAGRSADREKNAITLIISYPSERDEVEYAALALPTYPHLTKVSDDMLCALPKSDFDWKAFSLSCFRYRESPVPILNAQKLFSMAHSSLG